MKIAFSNTHNSKMFLWKGDTNLPDLPLACLRVKWIIYYYYIPPPPVETLDLPLVNVEEELIDE